MLLKELKQLNQCLELSTRAIANDNHLLEIDQPDAHVVQNLKNLTRAAEDFHSSASIKASTIFSGSHLGTDSIGEYGSTPSGHPTTTTCSKLRHIEMFLRRNQFPSRMDSISLSADLDEPLILKRTDYQEVVVGEGTGADAESNLDSKLSSGLGKMARKALRQFNFSEAEEILQRALERHKISAPDDARHSRLRTQLAICSFLQGRGTAIEEAVIDLVEFRGTKRPVAHQLLYNLALSHVHELNFKAALEICSRLYESLCNPDFSAHLKRNALLRLLVVSYRMSGETMDANAIEEEYPELASQADDGLPSILESVISCNELLIEFYGADNNDEVPSSFIHQLRSQSKLSKKSAFELNRIKQQMERETNTDRSIAGRIDSTEGSRDVALRQPASVSADSDHKTSNIEKFAKLKTLLRRQRILDGVKPDVSKASPNNTRYLDGCIKETSAPLPEKGKIESAFERQNEAPLWRKLSRWHLRKTRKSGRNQDVPTNENGDRTLDWTQGQGTLKKADSVKSIDTWDVASRVSAFSYVGMPSTPSCEYHHPTYTMAELPDTSLFEMMDTSPQIEPDDVEPMSVDVDTNHGCSPRSSASVASPPTTDSSYTNPKNAVLPDLIGLAMPGEICAGDKLQQQDHKDNSAPMSILVGTNSGFRNGLIVIDGYYGPDTWPRCDELVSSMRLDDFPRPPFDFCNQPDQARQDADSGSRIDGKSSLPSITSVHIEYNSDETPEAQSNTSQLTPNSESAFRWKDPCLYFQPLQAMSTEDAVIDASITREIPEELASSLERPGVRLNDSQPQGLDQDSGYELGHDSQRASTEDNHFVSGAIKAVRSRLRLLDQIRRPTWSRNQEPTYQEPHRWRTLRARLRLKPQRGVGQTFSIRQVRKVPQSGVVYEYWGPTAVAGPYTEQDEPPRSPCNFEFGVPDLPHEPGDIRVPIELDSRPIVAIRYA
ncbi:hypothetical protein KJ359_001678 [Pestalotiopsis sp. 9143b]|nr:hypothetical protein KJ359_001678 [Pestalotiopsis sp. 9143b]